MKIQRFEKGVKPLTQDFNAIGENRLEALMSLLGVFTFDPGAVLFDAVLPIVELQNGDADLEIRTLDQNIGIGGVVIRTPAYEEVFDVSVDTVKVEIYFLLRKVPVTASRNFLTLDPSNGARILQVLESQIAQQFVVDVIYMSQVNIAGAAMPPALGADDVGYVKLAHVTYDGSDIVVTSNDVPKFRLPAGTAVPPVSGHGFTHGPGGSDEMPFAELDNTIISGSSGGMMPEGALFNTRHAIQDLIPTVDSPYLYFVSTGTNTVLNGNYDPKYVQVGVRTDGSLTTLTDGSQAQLAVRFRPKTLVNGTEDTAARANHQHRLSESGFIIVNKSLALSEASLGNIIDVTISATDTDDEIAQIIDIEFFLELPNLDTAQNFEGHRLQVPWSIFTTTGSGLNTVGARYNTTGPRNYQVEVGSRGLIYLTPNMEALVRSWTAPIYSDGPFTKQGTLHMVITALREGALG